MIRPALAAAATAAAAAIVLGPAEPVARASAPSSLALTAQALLSPSATDLTLTVTSDTGPLPDELAKVQIRHVAKFVHVALTDGTAVLHLRPLERHRELSVRALVRTDEHHRKTHVLRARTTVQLRPDLVVGPLALPDPIVRRRPFTVTATVSETTGDTGAAAVATLLDGTKPVSSQLVSVGPGGSTVVTLTGSLERPPKHELTVVVSGAAPEEANTANNEASQDITIWLFPTDVVVSDNAEATAAGAGILKAGGNAFDAAAAVLFALNVTVPNVAGIGGSSNVVIVRPDGERFAVDARELAPAATSAETYKGQTLVDVSLRGYSAGVPTNLRAVDEMLRRWGTMTLADTLQPAISLAEGGVPARWLLTDRFGCLDARVPRFASSAAVKALCLDASDGSFTQPELASTFRLLAQQGVDAFYRGPVAQAIVDAVRSTPTGPGLMELGDLEHASVAVERPVQLTYHDEYTVLGAPPSTAGGLVTLETLGLLDRFPIGESPEWTFGQRNPIHVTLDAMRLAFADRDWWIGDGAAFEPDALKLLDPAYLADRGASIDPAKRIPEPTLPGDPHASAIDDSVDELSHTTHFSIVDRFGNAVAMTTTLGNSFGSGIVVPGYGFALNDSLDLFNLEPLRGVNGNPGANDAAGGKRPRGHMSPTVVLRGGEPVLLTGTYGSAFIGSLVVNVLIDVMDHGMSLREAVDAPRVWGARADPAVITPTATTAAWGLRFGPSTTVPERFDQSVIDSLKDVLGDRITRRPDSFPQFGALETAGVDPVTLEPVAAADTGRMPGAAGIVVDRS